MASTRISLEEQALRDVFQLGKLAGQKECATIQHYSQPIVLTPVCQIHEEIFLVRSKQGNAMYCPVCLAMQGVEEAKQQARLQFPLHGQKNFSTSPRLHKIHLVRLPREFSSLEVFVSEVATIAELPAMKAA